MADDDLDGKEAKLPELSNQMLGFLLTKHLSFGKVTPLNRKRAKDLYTKGKQLYESGKYKEAQVLFSSLVLLDPTSPHHFYALGSSSFALNDLSLAIESFLKAASMNAVDPMPYFFVSACYEKNGDLYSAMISLQAALKRSENQPKYQEIKHRAQMALDRLKGGSEQVEVAHG